jgi:hypothetical protein
VSRQRPGTRRATLAWQDTDLHARNEACAHVDQRRATRTDHPVEGRLGRNDAAGQRAVARELVREDGDHGCQKERAISVGPRTKWRLDESFSFGRTNAERKRRPGPALSTDAASCRRSESALVKHRLERRAQAARKDALRFSIRVSTEKRFSAPMPSDSSTRSPQVRLANVGSIGIDRSWDKCGGFEYSVGEAGDERASACQCAAVGASGE